MLSCKEVTELATSFDEGGLSFMQRMSFRMHVAMCRHCRTFMTQMRSTVRIVSKMPPVPVAPHVHDALMKAFRDRTR